MQKRQLIAHTDRTGAPIFKRKVNRRQMRNIANKWLKENGKKVIKSYETVRSWGRPKKQKIHTE